MFTVGSCVFHFLFPLSTSQEVKTLHWEPETSSQTKGESCTLTTNLWDRKKPGSLILWSFHVSPGLPMLRLSYVWEENFSLVSITSFCFKNQTIWLRFHLNSSSSFFLSFFLVRPLNRGCFSCSGGSFGRLYQRNGKDGSWITKSK